MSQNLGGRMARLGLLLGNFLGASVALSQESHYDQSWAEINQYSPVENYESQGSYGWRLGFGMLQSLKDETKSEFGPQEETLPAQIPRLQVNKGTRWPVDFGLSLSLLPESEQAWQYGGHVQWTLLEAFQRPTLALRVTRIETQGLHALSRLHTDSVQIGSSYAVFRLLTLSAAIGQQWQSWIWAPVVDQLALSPWEQQNSSLKRTVLSWGAKLQLFSPFLALGIEQIRLGPTQSVNHFKISVQL